MIVSAGQQRDSAIHIHVSIFPDSPPIQAVLSRHRSIADFLCYTIYMFCIPEKKSPTIIIYLTTYYKLKYIVILDFQVVMVNIYWSVDNSSGLHCLKIKALEEWRKQGLKYYIHIFPVVQACINSNYITLTIIIKLEMIIKVSNCSS